ncbi:hypothetical protein KC320_g8311 [Hortaea werneckii]|nr:hypothetical protein KC320_g8311 [Hortaea werneckii]
MHIEDKQLQDESDKKDQFDDYMDELDSDSEVQEHPIINGLPTDDNGDVPLGLTIRIRRTPKGQNPRGLIFTAEEGSAHAGPPQQVMFAEPRNWVSSSSREEVVFFRGTKTDGETPLGGVNFHHWLTDQSKAVIVTDSSGNEMDMRRTGPVTNEHGFVRGDKRFFWRRSRESGGIFKYHFECVDESDTQYAHYMSERRICSTGPDKTIGRFEVRKAGLKPELVESLLMTELALYVKLQKRVIQGSQAGNLGGLVAAALYVVGG